MSLNYEMLLRGFGYGKLEQHAVAQQDLSTLATSLTSTLLEHRVHFFYTWSHTSETLKNPSLPLLVAAGEKEWRVYCSLYKFDFKGQTPLYLFKDDLRLKPELRLEQILTIVEKYHSLHQTKVVKERGTQRHYAMSKRRGHDLPFLRVVPYEHVNVNGLFALEQGEVDALNACTKAYNKLELQHRIDVKKTSRLFSRVYFALKEHGKIEESEDLFHKKIDVDEGLTILRKIVPPAVLKSLES